MSVFSSFGIRARSAWNAFFNKDPTDNFSVGSSYAYRPDRMRFTRGNERSIITAIYNRIALDASSVDIKHVQLDKDGRYLDTIQSGLNSCFELEANVDQTGRAFIQDMVQSMLDEGCAAIVPVETDRDPTKTDSYDVLTIRVGKIVQWYPAHVKVELYNEFTGRREQRIFAKRMVAIVENPFYAVMNEPNSTMQRLIRKLNLLDVIDEKNSSGKLDLIISFPHIISTDRQRERAEKRRASIETQLASSKYGIAYTDGTERITQLNRPIENNLLDQIDYLQNLLYSQLGITKDVLAGTANESSMLNYYTRTIEPILSAITDEMKRKFLTKNARTRGQSIAFFRDPFRLVTISQMGEVVKIFIPNRTMTVNEVRQRLGLKPSNDEGADALLNPNIDKLADVGEIGEKGEMSDQPASIEGENQNEET